MTKFMTLGFLLAMFYAGSGQHISRVKSGVIQTQYSSPSIDVRTYHVRTIIPNVAPAIPGCTGTISSGSTSMSISSACGFQNGDGFAAFGAGAANNVTTPTGLTVTPSLMGAGAGTGIVVNTPTGFTRYCYTLIARDKPGGWSAAAVRACTNKGPASLGPQNVAVLGFTRSGNTVTATSSRHGLAPGASVNINTTTNFDNLYFGGHYVVASTPDDTHFTYVTGNDVANGAPIISNGGGTAYYATLIHLSWTSQPNAFKFYAYGRTDGSETYLGGSRVQSAINGLSPDTTFDDFGSPSMDGAKQPYFVPFTPPSSPLADPLVTTIVSGAGTTTLTLRDQASASVTNAIILFDNEPNIEAAAAQTKFASLLYFPGSIGAYVVNSYLTIPAAVSINLAGSGLLMNDTMEIQTGDKIFGMLGAQSTSFLQFGYPVGGSIAAGRADPAIYGGHAGLLYFYGIQIAAGSNGSVGFLCDDCGNSSFNYVNLTSGGSPDTMTIPLIIRASDFLTSFDHIADVVAQGPFFGMLPTPAFLYSGGNVNMSNLSFSGRGIFKYDKTAGPGANVVIDGASRIQGGSQPFFTFYNGAGSEGGSITINNVELDTMPHAMFANLSAGAYSGALRMKGIGGGIPALGFGMVTGKPIGFIDADFPSGQNTSTINGYSFTDNPVNVTGVGEFMVPIINTAAPRAIVSAGGLVPVGIACYAVTMVDVNLQEGTLGPNTCVKVTPGNQKVTIIPPATPVGAVYWLAYRGGAGGANDRISEHCFTVGAPFGTLVDDVTAYSCGHGAPTINRAGSQSISAAGLSGTGINLLGGGFKNAVSFNGTANRKTVLPDVSGSPISTVGYDSQTKKTSAQAPKLLTNPATWLPFTVGANDTLFRADVALACDLTSANATVLLTILYTDVSNTAQSQATTTANCTTLGAASVTTQAFLFMAKAGTSIQYSTTIVNTPSYDVRISLQQLGMN
jgi:hypothetical protein